MPKHLFLSYVAKRRLPLHADFSIYKADKKPVPASVKDIFLHLLLIFLIHIFFMLSLWTVPAYCGHGKDTLIPSEPNNGLSIYEVDHVRVLAKTVSTKKNDYLWKIFDRAGTLGQKMDSVRLVKIFKRLNPSIKNWDEIEPGQQLIIPVRIIRFKRPVINKRITHIKEIVTACQKKDRTPAKQKNESVSVKPKSDKKNLYVTQRDEVSIKNILKGKKAAKKSQKGIQIPDNTGKNKQKPHKKKDTKHHDHKPGTDKKSKSPVAAKDRRQISLTHEKTEKRHASAANTHIKSALDSYMLLPSLCMQTWPAAPFPVHEYLCEKSPSSRNIITKQSLPTSAKKENNNRAGKVVTCRKKTISDKLSEIFHKMGGEWIQTGEHFISLKSGGQLNLDAKSYPLVNFKTGIMVIVDTHNSLPEEVVRVIRSNWNNYRFVHLNRDDNLRTALHKILNRCGFSNVLEKGETYEFENNGIRFSIKGDWIVIDTKNSLKNRPRVIVLNLKKENIVPETIKRYIKGLNITVVNYPGHNIHEAKGEQPLCWKWDGTFGGLIEKLLALQGIAFKSHAKVPVYRNQRHDFNLTIVADLLFKIKGKDAIINFKSLCPETVTLLRENRYLVLPLSAEKNGLSIVKKALDFLSVKHTPPGPVSFKTEESSLANNLEMTLPGITFPDHNNHMILATTVPLPNAIMAFLWQKGYYVLTL